MIGGITKKKIKIRQQALSILLSRFGRSLDVVDRKSKYTNQSIYECAHDWVSQGNVNCNGIVKYYETTTMQKVINVLAVLSFVGTAGIIGGGTVVYLRRDAIAESVKERVAKAATEAIAGALPGMLDAAMPELPGATGGAIPGVPSTSGPSIPSF